MLFKFSQKLPDQITVRFEVASNLKFTIYTCLHYNDFCFVLFFLEQVKSSYSNYQQLKLTFSQISLRLCTMNIRNSSSLLLLRRFSVILGIHITKKKNKLGCLDEVQKKNSQVILQACSTCFSFIHSLHVHATLAINFELNLQ